MQAGQVVSVPEDRDGDSSRRPHDEQACRTAETEVLLPQEGHTTVAAWRPTGVLKGEPQWWQGWGGVSKGVGRGGGSACTGAGGRAMRNCPWPLTSKTQEQ